MFKRSDVLLDVLLMVAASVTGCALIGFAFYQGHDGPIAVPERVCYVAAAVFVLMPSLWAVFRKAGWSKRVPQ